MWLTTLVEAPVRLISDVLSAKSWKSKGFSRGKNFWNTKFSNWTHKGARKTWYWKNYPNYSDLSKNMANAKKIREKFSRL